MIASGILFVAVTVIVRYLGSDLPAVQAAFIRYLFGLLFVVPIMLRMRWREISTAKYGLYGLRGVTHAVAVMLWFFAMARIPIAEVTAIGYTTPVFTAIGAYVFFKETFYLRRVIAILVAFFGTLVILKPGFVQIEAGSLAQLIAAPCFAASFLFTKKLTQSSGSAEILAMLSLFCTLALMPLAIMQWQQPDASDLLWLALVAVFATAGHYTLTKSFSKAPLTVTQPFSFLQLVWAILAGYLIFSEVPDIWVITGALLIVGSVSYMTHRESRATRNS